MASNWTERRVVITGLGAVTPLGHEVEAFWSRLLAGHCGVERISRFDPSAFDAQIAAEVKNFDPATLLPGILVNTGPTNFHPIKAMQLQSWTGKTWKLFGDVIQGT